MIEKRADGEVLLNKVVRRLHVVGENYERALEEAQRRELAAAERKFRVERGWITLKAKREQVLDDVNAALRETGFQLHMSSDFGVLKDDEIDYLLVDIRGREHPTLGQVRLRVALKHDGMVVADLITDTRWNRLRRMTYEEFTPAAWRDLLVEHLDSAIAREEEAASES